MSNGLRSCAFILTLAERKTHEAAALHLRATRSSHSTKREKAAKAKDKSTLRHQRSPKRPKVDNSKQTPAKNTSPHGTPYTFRGEQLTKSENMREMRATYHAESTTIATSSAVAPRQLTQKELLLKRAAILDERLDTKLGSKDKDAFQYREERQLQYWSKGQSMMGQDDLNEQ